MKFMFLLYRRDGVSHDDCIAQWRGPEHSSIVSRIPGLLRWTQNALHEPLPNDGAPDGIGELWYSDAAAFEAAMASPESAAAFEDVERFSDPEKSYGFIVDEKLSVE